MKIKYLVIIGCLILLSGIAIAFYAIVADPFFMPFQDFDQMPKLQREAYISRSAEMENLKYFGLGMIAASTISTISILVYKQKNTP